MPTLPLTIGAALPVGALAAHRDWLIGAQRDLEIQDFYDGDLLDGDWRGLAREARAILDGYSGRLGIHGPTDGLPLICADRRVRVLVADRLRQGLECAAAFGATHMVVHSPFDFFGHPQVAHAPRHGLAQQLELAHDTLATVMPLAEQVGCALVVEVCYDTATAPLLALIRSFDSPWLRLSIDVGHAFLMQRAGGPPPDQWVRDGWELLEHLHLQDLDAHYDRHWAPGEGCLNWYAIFEALAELPHTPRLLLEISEAKVRQGADWLAALGYVV